MDEQLKLVSEAIDEMHDEFWKSDGKESLMTVAKFLLEKGLNVTDTCMIIETVFLTACEEFGG